MTLAERFRKRMDDLNLTQQEVADRAGVKQPSVVKILKGNTKKLKNLLPYSDALRCEPLWLSEGIGPMLKDGAHGKIEDFSQSQLTKAQERLLSLFDSSRPKIQDAILAILEAENEQKRPRVPRLKDSLKAPDRQQPENSPSDT